MLRKFQSIALTMLGLFVLAAGLSYAQTPAATTVPHLVHFTGAAYDPNGKPMTGTIGITFALYAEQSGGAALWLETQNVQADAKGNYSVELGAASVDGLPMDVFASGQARWLGVEISGQAEQPRILLLAVPYALKAADAETVGGLPPSAFLRAAGASGGQAKSAGPQEPAAASKTVKTNSPYGTANYLPLWTSASTIQNSNVFQSAAGNVGIGTAAPGAALDVNGTGNFSGLVTFASGQTFPGTISGVTTGPGSGLQGGGTSGSLNLSLTNACAANQVLQWSGSAWACASVGTGTITGVTAGTDLTGGGTSGAVTLNVDTTKVPQLAAANTFTGNQTVNGNLTATGVVTGSGYQIGSNLFAFGSYTNNNAFLGFAGNTAANQNASRETAVGWSALLNDTANGWANTASGYEALYSNTEGHVNTAIGAEALFFNTEGTGNNGFGGGALYYNTVGGENTGVGDDAGLTADSSNLTGSNNTFLGANAYLSTGTLNNAAAIGAYAEVTESNAIVLGAISGINNCTPALSCASVNVGIGTTTPAASLDVAAQNLHTYIGDACSASGYGGITFGTSGFNGKCSNYSLLGDGTNTFLNAPSGTISFRVGNASPSIMVVDSKGVGLGVGASNLLTLVQGGGPAIADGWDTYSSRRWKTNIQTLHGALAKVERLRGVSYDLKANGKHEVGVIAEEVGVVVPEIVSWEENGKDAQGVDYSRLTALLIEATKEQQAMIRQQQEQIRAQQKQIKAQRNESKLQEAQIEQLTGQVRAVQAALRASGPGQKEVRTVKTNVVKQ